jgi:hypothetical protein
MLSGAIVYQGQTQMPKKLSQTELHVMLFLLGKYDTYTNSHLYFPFAPIMEATGYDRAVVRRACRSLRRKGYAEYLRGLWSYDDGPAGAGYGATDAARALAADIEYTIGLDDPLARWDDNGGAAGQVHDVGVAGTEVPQQVLHEEPPTPAQKARLYRPWWRWFFGRWF